MSGARLARLGRLFLAPTVLAATATAAEPSLPRERDRWIQVESAHFTLFSNAGEKSTRRIGADLERLRAVIGQLFAGTELRSPVPTYLFVFKRDRDFEPYKTRYRGKTKDIAGYFASRQLGNYVAILAERRDQASRTVQHEYLHYVIDTNREELPLWLDEGLAEFYETFRVDDGEARIGYPLENHVLWLRQNRLIPLDELFAIDHDSPEYNEGSRRGVFYAQSWALVHMLLVGQPERRKQASTYARLLEEGLARDVAFERAFGGTYDDVERDLKRYLKRRSFSYLELPLEGEVDETMRVTPMAYADVLYRLGDLAAEVVRDDEGLARSHFEAALAADEHHGRAVAGLGYLAERAGDRAEAEARYAAAVALVPDDFAALYRLGHLLSEGLEELEGEEALAGSRRARVHLIRAVKRRPQFGQGWARLGYLYLFERELPPNAQTALENAHHLLPARVDVGNNLALLHARLGQRAGAEAALARMRAAGVDESKLGRARELVIQADVNRAYDLASAGTYAEAATLLEQVLPEATSDEQQRRIRRQLGYLYGRLGRDEDARAIAGSRSSDVETAPAVDEARPVDDAGTPSGAAAGIDRAYELANAGRFSEAIALLEPIVANTDDPGMGETLTADLDRMRDAASRQAFQGRLDAAMELVRAGEYERAIAALEELAVEAPEGAPRTAARELLDSLRATQAK